MKKLLILVLLGVFLMGVIGAVQAQTCHESSSNGYNNQAWHCPAGSCSSCNLYERYRCEDSARNSCDRASPTSTKWAYSGDRCRRKFTCDNSGYLNEYRCLGDIKQQKYKTVSCGSSINSCPVSYSWKKIETCENGCSNGACVTCDSSYPQSLIDFTECGAPVVNGCGVASPTLIGKNSSSCDPGFSCSPIGTCVEVGEAYWTDVLGNNISEAQFGDTVQMMAVGVNVNESDANFTIEIGATFTWWKPATWFASGSIETTASQYYTIQHQGDHQFNVDIPELGINNKESEVLEVHDSTQDDSTPTLKIITPSCGDIADVNEVLQIQVNSTDTDDLINGTVTFNDVVIENLTNGLNTIDYIPTEDGEIALRATLHSRGSTYTDSVNIIVQDESQVAKYAAACIDYPAPNTISPTNVVEFSAESTRGVICNGTICETLLPSNSSLQYNWTFPTSQDYSQVIMGNGSLDSIADVPPYLFNVTFSSSGRHPARLGVTVI